jgi:hypothetical protein
VGIYVGICWLNGIFMEYGWDWYIHIMRYHVDIMWMKYNDLMSWRHRNDGSWIRRFLDASKRSRSASKRLCSAATWRQRMLWMGQFPKENSTKYAGVHMGKIMKNRGKHVNNYEKLACAVH